MVRVSAAEAECRKLLKLQRREGKEWNILIKKPLFSLIVLGALLWLKKKKLFEKEIEGLESQLLRLDEAQHMRDAFRAVGLVASVLQASIATTRSNLYDKFKPPVNSFDFHTASEMSVETFGEHFLMCA